MTTAQAPRNETYQPPANVAAVMEQVWNSLKVVRGCGARCPECGTAHTEVRADRSRKFAYVHCCGFSPIFPTETYSLKEGVTPTAQPTPAPIVRNVNLTTPKEQTMSNKAIEDAIDDRVQETTTTHYPFAQWVNGDPKLARVGGVAAHGGLVIPFTRTAGKRRTENIPADFTLAGFTRDTFEFSSGQSEPVLAATSAALTVIRLRRCWFTRKDGQTTYYPWSEYADGYGMRGKYQVLVVIAGNVFALTFSGTNTREFDKVLADLDSATAKVAAGLGLKKALPRCGVTFTIKAGAVCTPNPKYTSKTTPPTLDTTVPATFVGVDALKANQALYLAAEAWVAAYNAPNTDQARNTNGAHLDTAEPVEEDPF